MLRLLKLLHAPCQWQHVARCIKGLCPPGQLGSIVNDVAVMLQCKRLHYVIVKDVVLVGLTGMHYIGCHMTGETKHVLRVPS